MPRIIHGQVADSNRRTSAAPGVWCSVLRGAPGRRATGWPASSRWEGWQAVDAARPAASPAAAGAQEARHPVRHAAHREGRLRQCSPGGRCRLRHCGPAALPRRRSAPGYAATAGGGLVSRGGRQNYGVRPTPVPLWERHAPALLQKPRWSVALPGQTLSCVRFMEYVRRHLAQYRCSTPCGINEMLTQAVELALEGGVTRAQRLAAPMECSPENSHATSTRKVCSTPCGINGMLTVDGDIGWCGCSACSTPCGINGMLTSIPRSPCGAEFRAQRLAASMECSQLVWSINHPVRAVLNALRHQWNAHTFTDYWRAGTVLCSTPCGINGMLTATPGGGQAPHRVLNALRHQWNAHALQAAGAFRYVMCSTPCGINGMLTDSERSSKRWRICAQRLAASMECSQFS